MANSVRFKLSRSIAEFVLRAQNNFPAGGKLDHAVVAQTGHLPAYGFYRQAKHVGYLLAGKWQSDDTGSVYLAGA